MWEAGKSVFSRMMDGVEPGIIDDIRQAVNQVKDGKDITEI
ncbi:MAG: hypothetical protein QM426_01665 [Euryarchaeota archaeon]|nr:hypothetical protein [Euryarchaeota archaeon]